MRRRLEAINSARERERAVWHNVGLVIIWQMVESGSQQNRAQMGAVYQCCWAINRHHTCQDYYGVHFGEIETAVYIAFRKAESHK